MFKRSELSAKSIQIKAMLAVSTACAVIAIILEARNVEAAPGRVSAERSSYGTTLQGPRLASAAAVGHVTAMSEETAGPLTYQAWKSLRVDEARLVLERLTLESQFEKMPIIDRSPGERQAVIRTGETNTRPATVSRGTKTGRPEKGPDSRADSRAEQARMNLEIAQDLTVNDYLLIYLTQFKSREAILDVARRLAPEDIADLLVAYQKLAIGGQIAEHSAVTAPRISPRPL